MEMTKNLKSRDETDRISLSLQVNQVITKLGNELLAAKNDAMDRDRQMMSLLLKVVTQQKLHDTYDYPAVGIYTCTGIDDKDCKFRNIIIVHLPYP